MKPELLEELVAAAKQAHEVLALRWFVSLDDGDCDNDYEVISADERLTSAIQAVEDAQS
jgi:hypothetical protein